MKFIITISGPAMNYRLDLIKASSPNITKDYMIVFTDAHSYNLYKDHHNDFEFVIIDDIRKDYPISLQYEQFLQTFTEKEHFEKLVGFYNGANKRLYPYDIHRFIFPYLAERNILKFALIDSDVIFFNDTNVIKEYCDSLPKSTLHIHWFNEEVTYKSERANFFKNHIQPLFPQITLDSSILRSADGYIRGFDFKNKEDMMLFFNIWNTSLEYLFDKNVYEIGGTVILDVAWVSPYIMQFFQNIGYNFRDSNDFINNYKLNTKYYKHCTRPEDTFYFGERGGWKIFNFNYSNTTDISSFIKNNKQQLIKYYNNHIPHIEVTDTHVYTKL